MSNARNISILTGLCRGQPVIRLQGPCTFAACERIRKYLDPFRKPATTDLYFDLSEVPWIDSTFAGFLVSLATRRHAQDRPELHLIAPSEGVLDALGQMHLIVLFDILQALDENVSEWKELPADDGSAQQTGDMVIECHERLIEADPRNAKAFGPVVEAFRSDRQRRRSSEGDGLAGEI